MVDYCILKKSLRIETMLEDAYNERMHLLTFLKMAEPGWFMKLVSSFLRKVATLLKRLSCLFCFVFGSIHNGTG